MHLLKAGPEGTIVRETFYGDPPPYAILSHRWLDDEPTYQDITNGTGHDKQGYDKLDFCLERIPHDSLEYFWVDTVCIDKTSSAELTEALNSMFRWYQEAVVCYAYMHDVSSSWHGQERIPVGQLILQFRNSGWFTRGWTLQELIAPKNVDFFTREKNFMFTKATKAVEIAKITGIDVDALRGMPLRHFDVDTRMKWAEKRVTTREEDKAYCLMGIFDVFMPIIYGERGRAFRRLREEIAKLGQAISSSFTLSMQWRTDFRQMMTRLGTQPANRPRQYPPISTRRLRNRK